MVETTTIMLYTVIGIMALIMISIVIGILYNMYKSTKSSGSSGGFIMGGILFFIFVVLMAAIGFNFGMKKGNVVLSSNGSPVSCTYDSTDTLCVDSRTFDMSSPVTYPHINNTGIYIQKCSGPAGFPAECSERCPVTNLLTVQGGCE